MLVLYPQLPTTIVQIAGNPYSTVKHTLHEASAAVAFFLGKASFWFMHSIYIQVLISSIVGLAFVKRNAMFVIDFAVFEWPLAD